jgi:hypothetical protein
MRLFNLFISDEMLKKSAIPSMPHAQLHRNDDDKSAYFKIDHEQVQMWQEIKVFFAVLIYMRLHDSSQTDCY